MDVKTTKEILKRDYGIETFEQLLEAMKKCQGIDIGIFVSDVRNADSKKECSEVA